MGVSIVLLVLGLLAFAGIVLTIVYLTQPRRGVRRTVERLATLTQDMVLTNSKGFPGAVDRPSLPPALVIGQAVVTANPVVRRLTYLRRLFGGELGFLRHLSQWAYYLALERMVEEARRRGYNAITNIRIEMSDLGQAFGRPGTIMSEVYVYGTAYQVVPQQGGN